MKERRQNSLNIEKDIGACSVFEAGMPIGGAPTRRDFLGEALAVSALCGLSQSAAAQALEPRATAQEVNKIREMSSQNGKLRAVISVRNAYKMLPADPSAGTVARRTMLRYFEGKDSAGNLIWPPEPIPGDALPTVLPGPTLRGRVGDQVEITFLNHVRVDDFAGSLDRSETGDAVCDTTVEATQGTKIYPEGAGDSAPDCLHGSSTANLHFHGTHVTPDGLGDNVLLQLRPNPNVTESSVQGDFAQIFAAGPPAHWSDLPRSWRGRQFELLKEYDDTAVWQGKRGTPGNPELPPDNRLLPQVQAQVRAGLWPQYQIGAYPYCFKITEGPQGSPTRHRMGQCPGTHWYHAHKHGSTAINVLNGMAGVFVIEGASYDDALINIYPNLKQTEKVLIIQNFSDAPNIISQTRFMQPPSLWTNGQLIPNITMRPGEIQLWRLVNASIRAVTTPMGFDHVDGVKPETRQIAQDGVQFHYENYKKLVSAPPRTNCFAPGNRIDMLVKAPSVAGSYVFNLDDTTQHFNLDDTVKVPILTLVVSGDAVSPAMEFPSEANYPSFPGFLGDIKSEEIRIWRRLDFGWEAGRSAVGLLPPAPRFMIDGRQFRNGRYDQTMILGDSEEWTLTNSTRQIAHPFHIHVNPFQVVEIYDPAAPVKLYKPDQNFIWQDVIAIPPATYDDAGKVKEKGYVKIRHRFVDFPGSYVLHCHMLAHEDRGMMQLLRVISSETDLAHH